MSSKDKSSDANNPDPADPESEKLLKSSESNLTTPNNFNLEENNEKHSESENEKYSESKNLDTNLNHQLHSDLKPNKGTINARTVLWYLVFFGFAINYMIRINLNIALVDMISINKAVKTNHMTECYNNSGQTSAMITTFKNGDNKTKEFNGHLNETAHSSLNASTKLSVHLLTKHKRYSLERLILDYFKIKYDKNGFKWNELDQGRVLGSFYLLHWVLQIPSGILAKMYGTKLVFGLSNFIGCLICFFMPIAAYWNVDLLIFLRIIQGFITGLAWPSMHHMASQWVAPDERSKFVSAYLGGSVGIALLYPFFGYIISALCWEWVFYISGIIGCLWYITWLYYVFDSPAEHPRIDPEERIYIETSLAGSVKHDKMVSTPWVKILTSRPIWMNIVAQWGGIWGLFTLITQAPTYFNIIHGWSLQTTGLLCGVPHLLRMLFAYVFSTFADSLLRKNKMSRTNVRKMAGAVCTIVNGLFTLGLAFSGCNSTAAVIFLSLATAAHGAVSAGPLASIIDISPNFSAVILGITGTIATCAGFVSPYVVAKLTLGNQTVQQWQYVFLITAGMLIGSGIIYVLFSKSTLQSWNQIDSQKNNAAEQELEILNGTKSKDIECVK